jgi:Na+/melibiose symporter-like transporter
LAEYGYAIKLMLSNRPLMLIFGVYILNNFQMTMRGTYLSIYLVDALKLNDALISVFPAVSSVAMLILMFSAVPRFNAERYERYMMLGFSISIAANIILIIAPVGNILVVIISTILAAAGAIIANPYLEAAVANAIDDENRAKIFSILTVFILICISPAGIIGGWTYTVDPRLPFILVTLAFIAGIALMAAFVKQQKSYKDA